MKTLVKSTLLLVALLLSHQVDAQIWKNVGGKIKKKLENQADQRLERKIDKTIDKSFDKVEQSAEDAVKTKPKENHSNDDDDIQIPGFDMNSMDMSSLERMMAAMTKEVPVADVYKFHLGVKYNIQSATKKKKEEDMQMAIWFSDKGYVGMNTDKQAETFIIIDENALITFMEKEKSYLAISNDLMRGFTGMVEEYADDMDDDDGGSFKKIGTDKVLGYTCDIYEVKSDDGAASKVWISKEFKAEGKSLIQAFAGLGQEQSSLSKLDLGPLEGLILKVESQEDGERMTMIATEVNRNGKQIKTKDYKKTGF